MRTVDVIELEDLMIPDPESADRISAALSKRRGVKEQSLLHTAVLITESEDQRLGRQQGRSYLALLEFSNTELHRRFGLLWSWEQRYLVRALIGKLSGSSKTQVRPVLSSSVEVGFPWSPTTRRRISVEMKGIQRVNDDVEPTFGYILRIGLI